MSSDRSVHPAQTALAPVQPSRRNVSANRSRRFELERLRRMSIETRIKAALSMDTRYAWLKPVVEDP